MNYIENTYICLAAPLFLAILCLHRDTRRNLSFLLAGMSACLLSAYVSAYAAGTAQIDLIAASYELAPVVEEIMKFLPVLFYILVFEPERNSAISGTFLVSVGFATFENVCFLTSYGTSNLLRLLIRGFGTGAMHVVCGMIVAVGLFFLWHDTKLRVVGVVALLCFAIRFHAIFNLLVNQTGFSFWVGSAIPLTMVIFYLIVLRKRVVPS